jgi:hypothetical protein
MIKDLSFLEKSLFFANVSALAYKDPKSAKPEYASMGFTSKYFDHKGSQAYVLQNKQEIIIAFRRNRAR